LTFDIVVRSAYFFFCLLQVTFIIILGGTDVNCCLQSMEKKEQMDFVMQRAGSIVAFNQNMKLKLCGAIPTLSTKIFTIAQSCPILQTIENKSDVRKSYWRQRLGYCSNHFIVLLPASIRSVKAPHFILKDFEQYQNDVNPNARLVIVGPILDEDYVHQQPGVGYIIRQSMELEQRCTSDDAGTAFSPPLRYLPPISREDLLSLMSDVNVVINTSESEGECGVILEAMTLGIPVVARNNSGNAALISHGSTGWLYDTPKECIDLLADVYTSCLPQEGDNKYVYCDSVKDVCNRAKESALHGHSQEIETTQYRELLCEVKKTHLFTESMN
jgi:glycosyltransferase involved in cell wall biosynthesis